MEFTSGTGHKRSHIPIVALRPDIHELPEEAYPRLSPGFDRKLQRDQAHLVAVSLSVHLSSVIAQNIRTII